MRISVPTGSSSSASSDLELAFPTREEVLDVLEQIVVASFEALGRTPPSRPFPRMSYADAMLRYGSDKPDLRFGLEIQDATALTRDSQFGVFANAETDALPRRAEGVSSRAVSCRSSRTFAKEWGAKGLAYLVYDENREVALPDREGSFRRESSKHFARRPVRRCSSSRTARRWWSGCSAPCVSTWARSSASSTSRVTSSHWVLDFPLFLKDEDTGQWTFVHQHRSRALLRDTRT